MAERRSRKKGGENFRPFNLWAANSPRSARAQKMRRNRKLIPSTGLNSSELLRGGRSCSLKLPGYSIRVRGPLCTVQAAHASAGLHRTFSQSCNKAVSAMVERKKPSAEYLIGVRCIEKSDGVNGMFQTMLCLLLLVRQDGAIISTSEYCYSTETYKLASYMTSMVITDYCSRILLAFSRGYILQCIRGLKWRAFIQVLQV